MTATRLAFGFAVGAALFASGCALLYPVRKDDSSPAGVGGSKAEGGPPDGGTEAGMPGSCHNELCSAAHNDAPWICRKGCVPTAAPGLGNGTPDADDCCRALRTDDCPIAYPGLWRY